MNEATMNDAPQQSLNAPPALSGRAVVAIVAGVLVMALGFVFAWQRWEIYGFSRLPAALLLVVGFSIVSGACGELLRLGRRDVRTLMFGFLSVQLMGIVWRINEYDSPTGRIALLITALTALYVFAPVLKALIAHGRR